MIATLDEPDVAESASGPLVTYTPSDAAIAKMRSEMTPLADPVAVRTAAGYEKVRVAVGTVRKLRVGVESRRKELKAESLAWGRKVDAEAKRLTGLLSEIEDPLQALKDAVDAEKEAKRKAAEDAERARVEAEVRAKREAEEARLKAIRDAEDERLRIENERLAAERAKLDAERKAVEEQQRVERERVAKEQAVEQARLKAERDAVEAQQRMERAKIDAERKALADEKERQDRAEFERQAKIKAETDAKDRIERERAEAERLAKEKADADAAEKVRIEAMRPDVEKIHAFASILKRFATESTPKVETPAAVKLIGIIESELLDMAKRCQSFKA